MFLLLLHVCHFYVPIGGPNNGALTSDTLTWIVSCRFTSLSTLFLIQHLKKVFSPFFVFRGCLDLGLLDFSDNLLSSVTTTCVLEVSSSIRHLFRRLFTLLCLQHTLEPSVSSPTVVISPASIFMATKVTSFAPFLAMAALLSMLFLHL